MRPPRPSRDVLSQSKAAWRLQAASHAPEVGVYSVGSNHGGGGGRYKSSRVREQAPAREAGSRACWAQWTWRREEQGAASLSWCSCLTNLSGLRSFESQARDVSGSYNIHDISSEARLCESLTWKKKIAKENGEEDLLLLEIVLPRAARFAAGEGALMVPLAGVHSRVAGEVPARSERPVACSANMLLLRRRCRRRNRRTVPTAAGGTAAAVGVTVVRVWAMVGHRDGR